MYINSSNNVRKVLINIVPNSKKRKKQILTVNDIISSWNIKKYVYHYNFLRFYQINQPFIVYIQVNPI